jgi:hypothetical protein
VRFQPRNAGCEPARLLKAPPFVTVTDYSEIIDERFNQLENTLGARLELQAAVAKEYLENEIGVYPTISELVYRAKNGADRVRQAKTNMELFNEDLLFSCRELTEQLRRFRLYLPKEIFDDLHHYKHLLQDLLVIGDILTRPTPPKAVKELEPDVQSRIVCLCDELAHACDGIIAKLQARIRTLQGPVGLTRGK